MGASRQEKATAGCWSSSAYGRRDPSGECRRGEGHPQCRGQPLRPSARNGCPRPSGWVQAMRFGEGQVIMVRPGYALGGGGRPRKRPCFGTKNFVVREKGDPIRGVTGVLGPSWRERSARGCCRRTKILRPRRFLGGYPRGAFFCAHVPTTWCSPRGGSPLVCGGGLFCFPPRGVSLPAKAAL